MRANAQRIEFNETSIDGFVSLLDDFAALPAQAAACRARGSSGRAQAHQAASNKPFKALMPAHTRASIAGLLLILLAGGLGFAIWTTRPQSCVGCDDAVALAPSAQASHGASPTSRFEYAALSYLDQMLNQQPARSARYLSPPSSPAQGHDQKPPVLATANGDDDVTPLPMTTSATGRLFRPQSLTDTAAEPPWHSPRLPPVATDAAEVAPEPLKFTAASEIPEDVASTPSVLAVERSSINEAAKIDIPLRKSEALRTRHPQIQSQRPRRTARARKNVDTTQSNNPIPPWARKMFRGNWQSTAFSYQNE